MTQSEFLKRWLMHYVHPEYFYIPWADNQVGTVTLNLTLRNSPVADVPNCLCTFYIYNVDTDEYMEFTEYEDWYVGKPMKISGQSGDVVTINPWFTDKNGLITLRLPYGTYQYIEYECVYGKIIKQPVQFVVDKTERTVNIPHQAAYLHTSIGDEVVITTQANVVSEEDYDYDGLSRYFQPSQTVDIISYGLFWSDGWSNVASASDNTDRPYWNFGHTVIKPSGHKETKTERHYWKNNFNTTMDWNVTCTQIIEDQQSPWSETALIYGTVDFRINENNYCERYLTFKKQERYEEAPAMYWVVNGDRQNNYFHENNPSLMLNYEDNIENRRVEINWLDGSYVINNGKRGEKRYDVVYEDTGDFITYQEVCQPAMEQYYFDTDTQSWETYSEPQVDDTGVASTTGGIFAPYWWLGIPLQSTNAVWVYLSNGIEGSSTSYNKPIYEDDGQFLDYNYTIRGNPPKRIPMRFSVNFTQEELAANIPDKKWKDRVHDYQYVRQIMAEKIQVTIP